MFSLESRGEGSRGLTPPVGDTRDSLISGSGMGAPELRALFIKSMKPGFPGSGESDSLGGDADLPGFVGSAFDDISSSAFPFRALAFSPGADSVSVAGVSAAELLRGYEFSKESLEEIKRANLPRMPSDGVARAAELTASDICILSEGAGGVPPLVWDRSGERTVSCVPGFSLPALGSLSSWINVLETVSSSRPKNPAFSGSTAFAIVLTGVGRLRAGAVSAVVFLGDPRSGRSGGAATRAAGEVSERSERLSG